MNEGIIEVEGSINGWEMPSEIQQNGADSFRRREMGRKEYLIVDTRQEKFRGPDGELLGASVRYIDPHEGDEVTNFWVKNFESRERFESEVIAKTLEYMGHGEAESQRDEFDPRKPGSGDWHDPRDMEEALRYFDTQKEAADHWGISQASVTRMKQKIEAQTA